VPVPNAPVTWTVASGGGSLQFQDALTNQDGLAGAEPVLGAAPGVNDYFAIAGGLSTDFLATGLAQPTIPANGAVDAASFVKGRAVAPGSYVAIFGSNLALGTQINGTVNLPVSLGPVSVSFDTATASVAGHLAFVTPGQVNVQVPWEMQGQTSAQMKVTVQDAAGNLYTLPVAAYSPGIFAIMDENGNVVSASNPARQGHNITIYCNGLGPVTNQPASGDPSPSNPLARTVAQPTVSLGSQNAVVLFSGLTPTTVGLYQINATVPNVGAGMKTIGISIGGVNSPVSNIVVQ
jgi:minor extracellular serine protease Vpr